MKHILQQDELDQISGGIVEPKEGICSCISPTCDANGCHVSVSYSDDLQTTVTDCYHAVTTVEEACATGRQSQDCVILQRTQERRSLKTS